MTVEVSPVEALARTQAVIGGKWTVEIVSALLLLCNAAMVATLTARGGSVAAATILPIVTPVPSAVGSANCGIVQKRGPDTVNGPAARRSEDCIWQAYQQCATMGTAFLTIQTEASPSTEIATTRDFTVQGSAGGCTIEESVTSQIFAPPSNPVPTTTYTCAGLTRDPDGALHFQACGKDGEIVVAAPALAPRSAGVMRIVPSLVAGALLLLLMLGLYTLAQRRRVHPRRRARPMDG